MTHIRIGKPQSRLQFESVSFQFYAQQFERTAYMARIHARRGSPINQQIAQLEPLAMSLGAF